MDGQPWGGVMSSPLLEVHTEEGCIWRSREALEAKRSGLSPGHIGIVIATELVQNAAQVQ